MAATAWVMVVYAYALAYLHLHAAGESFAFEHDEEPTFRDFAGLALMVSSAGSAYPSRAPACGVHGARVQPLLRSPRVNSTFVAIHIARVRP